MPSISRLKDFPNLSLPAPHVDRIVRLPNSAPTSPTQKSIVSGGDLLTPSTSPNQTPVIQWNPALLPFSPLQRQTSSTPLGSPVDRQPTNPVGSWDNFQQDPTFFGDNQQFWKSRQIQIVSTDQSDLSDVSLLSSKGSISTLDLLQSQQIGVLDTALLGSQFLNQNIAESKMSEDKESDMSNISQLEIKVKDMCSDLDPQFITTQSAPSMKEELNEIGLIRDEYRNSIRHFLVKYSTEITPLERSQLESGMSATLNTVRAHKFAVLEKVNMLLPPASQMSEFERETIELQKKQLKLQEDAVKGQETEALAITKPLKKLIVDKCTDLEEDLMQTPEIQIRSGDDQLVTKIMLKLESWRNKLDSVISTYQEFQTKTAVHRLSDAEQTADDACVVRVKDLLSGIETAV